MEQRVNMNQDLGKTFDNCDMTCITYVYKGKIVLSYCVTNKIWMKIIWHPHTCGWCIKMHWVRDYDKTHCDWERDVIKASSSKEEDPRTMTLDFKPWKEHRCENGVIRFRVLGLQETWVCIAGLGEI